MGTTKNMKKTNRTKASEKMMLSFQCDAEQAKKLKAKAEEAGLPYSYLLRTMLGKELKQEAA